MKWLHRIALRRVKSCSGRFDHRNEDTHRHGIYQTQMQWRRTQPFGVGWQGVPRSKDDRYGLQGDAKQTFIPYLTVLHTTCNAYFCSCLTLCLQISCRAVSAAHCTINLITRLMQQLDMLTYCDYPGFRVWRLLERILVKS